MIFVILKGDSNVSTNNSNFLDVYEKTVILHATYVWKKFLEGKLKSKWKK